RLLLRSVIATSERPSHLLIKWHALHRIRRLMREHPGVLIHSRDVAGTAIRKPEMLVAWGKRRCPVDRARVSNLRPVEPAHIVEAAAREIVVTDRIDAVESRISV